MTYNPEFAAMARKACECDRELAALFGVNVDTINEADSKHLSTS
jgi:hypothetical protein